MFRASNGNACTKTNSRNKTDHSKKQSQRCFNGISLYDSELKSTRTYESSALYVVGAYMCIYARKCVNVNNRKLYCLVSSAFPLSNSVLLLLLSLLLLVCSFCFSLFALFETIRSLNVLMNLYSDRPSIFHDRK